MRVLFVAPDLPHPPFTGAHTWPLSIMRALARDHDIVAVGTLPSATGDASAVGAPSDALRELCTGVMWAPADATRAPSRALLSRARTTLSPVPLIGRGFNPTIAAMVNDAVRRHTPDVLHLHTMYAVHYRKSSMPAVVDLSDVVSGLCDAAARAHPVRYAWTHLQAVSSRRQERRLLAGVAPITINEDDRLRLSHLGVSAYTVPLAIELPDLHGDLLHDDPAGRAAAPAAGGDRRARTSSSRSLEYVELLFVGSFLHAPNREAARFLLEKLAPELRCRGLCFRLTIAGRGARLQALGVRRPFVDTLALACAELHSDPPDLAPFYRRSDIVLVPLPHGGGTKNKTLEAMAYSRPVIGTPQAFTGLGSDARAAYAVTSYDAAALAMVIAELAAHPLRRVRMARCGREYVAAHHSQDLVNRRVRVLYDAIGRGEGVAAAEASWRDRARPD
jgi:hypothetical protein